MQASLLSISNFIRAFIASFLILAPFIVLSDIGMYDSKRILQILLLASISLCYLLLSFLASDHQKKNHANRFVVYLLSFFFCLGIISSLNSQFPRFAFIEVIMMVILIISFVLLSESTLKGHYQLGKFIYLISFLFASIYLMLFFGNFISSHLDPLVPLWPDRLSIKIKLGDTIHKGKEVLYFGNRRFFNHIQTWTLPLLVSLALYIKTKIAYRTLILLLLTCWWSLAFASGARGTIVAFVLACIVLSIIFRKRVYNFISTAACTSIAGFLVYYLMFKAFTPSQSLPVVRMSDTGRLEKWQKAWELWLENPTLGIGPMHYASIGGENYSAHPHNFYLQILTEWGIIALICFLALLILYLLFIKKAFLLDNFKFKKLSPRNTAVYMGFIGSAVAGFSHAGVSGIFHTPISQIWAIIILAWFVSLWNRNNNNKKAISIQRKYLAVFYFVLISGLIYLITPDIGSLDKDHENFLKENDKAKISPRFWEQGLILEKEERTTVTEEVENQD